MACYWYDPNYTLSTCSYSVGDALRACDCEGDVDSCPLREFGRKVGFKKDNTDDR